MAPPDSRLAASGSGAGRGSVHYVSNPVLPRPGSGSAASSSAMQQKGGGGPLLMLSGTVFSTVASPAANGAPPGSALKLPTFGSYNGSYSAGGPGVPPPPAKPPVVTKPAAAAAAPAPAAAEGAREIKAGDFVQLSRQAVADYNEDGWNWTLSENALMPGTTGEVARTYQGTGEDEGVLWVEVEGRVGDELRRGDYPSTDLTVLNPDASECVVTGPKGPRHTGEVHVHPAREEYCLACKNLPCRRPASDFPPGSDYACSRCGNQCSIIGTPLSGTSPVAAAQAASPSPPVPLLRQLPPHGTMPSKGTFSTAPGGSTGGGTAAAVTPAQAASISGWGTSPTPPQQLQQQQQAAAAPAPPVQPPAQPPAQPPVQPPSPPPPQANGHAPARFGQPPARQGGGRGAPQKRRQPSTFMRATDAWCRRARQAPRPVIGSVVRPAAAGGVERGGFRLAPGESGVVAAADGDSVRIRTRGGALSDFLSAELFVVADRPGMAGQGRGRVDIETRLPVGGIDTAFALAAGGAGSRRAGGDALFRPQWDCSPVRKDRGWSGARPESDFPPLPERSRSAPAAGALQQSRAVKKTDGKIFERLYKQAEDVRKLKEDPVHNQAVAGEHLTGFFGGLRGSGQGGVRRSRSRDDAARRGPGAGVWRPGVGRCSWDAPPLMTSPLPKEPTRWAGSPQRRASAPGASLSVKGAPRVGRVWERLHKDAEGKTRKEQELEAKAREEALTRGGDGWRMGENLHQRAYHLVGSTFASTNYRQDAKRNKALAIANQRGAPEASEPSGKVAAWRRLSLAPAPKDREEQRLQKAAGYAMVSGGDKWDPSEPVLNRAYHLTGSTFGTHKDRLSQAERLRHAKRERDGGKTVHAPELRPWDRLYQQRRSPRSKYEREPTPRPPPVRRRSRSAPSSGSGLTLPHPVFVSPPAPAAADLGGSQGARSSAFSAPTQGAEHGKPLPEPPVLYSGADDARRHSQGSDVTLLDPRRPKAMRQSTVVAVTPEAVLCAPQPPAAAPAADETAAPQGGAALEQSGASGSAPLPRPGGGGAGGSSRSSSSAGGAAAAGGQQHSATSLQHGGDAGQGSDEESTGGEPLWAAERRQWQFQRPSGLPLLQLQQQQQEAGAAAAAAADEGSAREAD